MNGEHFPTIGGGILFDAARGWLSAGGQGELFSSNGYVAGRGGVIAQANVIRRRAVRPFVLGGYGWGEDAGAIMGAGIEVWGSGRAGFRASVQDSRARIPYKKHQPSVQIGIIWR